MKRFRIFSKKTIIAGSVIFVSFLFVLMAFSPALAGTGQQTPQAITEKSYIPNPTLNTNITWSAYNSTWAPMQYWNGTGYQNLTTGYSTFYKNPIGINAGDITPKTLNGQVKGINYFDPANYNGYGINNQKIGNTSNGIYLTGNASSTKTLYDHELVQVPWADMPSTNLQCDYITAVLSMSAGSGSTAKGTIAIENDTGSTTYDKSVNAKTTIGAGQSMFISEPISEIIAGSGLQVNESQSTYIYIGIYLQQAAGAPADTPIANLTMTNFDITTYPVILGENSTGAKITEGTGIIQMSKFAPTVPMEVLNNGYSVAVSQEMTNTTESQAAISDGNYIEEATYQGTLTLPTAPDLRYGTANVSLNMTLPGTQYEVATLNGISYLKGVQASNSTYLFGNVNPNTPNSMILEAKYTASQWDSSTHAPSFFTLRGIEYYWWVGVIGLLSLIGLGAAAMSHFGGEEEALKVPKGKFGR